VRKPAEKTSPIIKTLAVLCYLVSLAGAVAFGLRLFQLGQGWTTLGPENPWSWPINLGWLLLFGLQHSGMARNPFKQAWLRVIPSRLEMSFYAVTSGLILLGMALTWQPIDGPPLWTLPSWMAVIALIGAMGLAAINLRFDHFGLFGLRQAWEENPTEDVLLVQGPYRFVRHPLMACLLLVLWAHPVMSPMLTLLSGGLTVYIGVGLILEERDLLRKFGPAYAEYQQRVPALVPWRRPVPPSTHSATNVP